MDRIWIIQKNTTKHKQYTSDNPVVGIQVGDQQHPIYQISMPLTPDYVICILIEKQVPELAKYNNKIIDLSYDNLKHYNSLILIKSNRQIYSCENDFRFALKILTDDPTLRDTDRRRVHKIDFKK